MGGHQSAEGKEECDDEGKDQAAASSEDNGPFGFGVLPRVRNSLKNRGREVSTDEQTKAANAADNGPFGYGMLPRVRCRVKRWLMADYLKHMYHDVDAEHPGRSCTGVSHTTGDLANDSLNVAMPEFSCEQVGVLCAL